MPIKQVLVTVTATAATQNINEDDVIIALENGTGSSLTFKSADSAERKVIVIDETPTAVSTQGTSLIVLTERDGTDIICFNTSRIMSLKDDSASKAELEYDYAGVSKRKFLVDETEAAALAIINAI